METMSWFVDLVTQKNQDCPLDEVAKSKVIAA
jgi:hypothetical protein